MSTVDLTRMPIDEKLRLMESLWDSLCGQAPAELEMPTWHKEVLDERLLRLASGEDSVTPWAEAKERIRGRTKAG